MGAGISGKVRIRCQSVTAHGRILAGSTSKEYTFDFSDSRSHVQLYYDGAGVPARSMPPREWGHVSRPVIII